MASIKTRADLKAQLQRTVPHGAEVQYLADADARLRTLQAQLAGLEERRSAVRRAVTIRERKLRDIKGKIPRSGAVPCVRAVRSTFATTGGGSASAVVIGRMRGGMSELEVLPRYAAALDGVDGFDKLWVFYALMTSNSGSKCEIHSQLVDVTRCDPKKRVISIRGFKLELDEAEEEEEVKVVDIKPYLPYCEAWPAGDDGKT